MVRTLKLILKEVFYTLILIVGVSALLYMFFNLMPGDYPGKGGGARAYLDLLRSLLTFRFGRSVVSGINIGSLVFPAFRNTLVLTIGAICISLIVAVPIGIFAAFKSFRSYSWPAMVFSYIISSIPVFYLGYLVLFLVSRQTGFLPIFYPNSMSEKYRFLSYVLPIVVLGMGNDAVSEIVRLISTELGRVMSTEYVIASKARGESVLASSVNEGIAIPLVSIVFAKIPFLLGGAVIVEYVFNWPGMGRLAFESTLDRDLPVLIVIAFLAVLMVRAGMILKEILLDIFNPGKR
jgi:ABC-type dipeptide/oligopeptide/nickel transport system permease component